MASFGEISTLVTGDDDRQQRNLNGTLAYAGLWLALSGGAVFLYAIAVAIPGGRPDFVRLFFATIATAALVGVGAFAVGALLGFLFGIPKTVPPPAAPAGTSGAAPAAVAAQQEVNTNLEQVSDWLTKILVGVGLTQFRPLSESLWQLAEKYEQLGGPAIAFAIIMNFVITGFLCGYLVTRLFLARAFVDVFAASEVLRKQTEKAKDLEKESDWGRALNAYEVALAQVTPTTPKPQKRQVYEGAMYNALYQAPPDGFQKAIKYGTEFMVEEPGLASARIWAYLGAAYGQKYRYLQQNKGSPQDLTDARAKALESIKAGLQADPNIRELLRLMWDPNSPIKSPEDNDLEVFFDDPDFKALLGS